MRITEELIRKVTLATLNEIGDTNDLSLVQKIVTKTISELSDKEINQNIKNGVDMATDSDRIILTAYGQNRPGIVSTITTVLADYSCDILDLTQKILQEYFTMIMFVEISGCKITFNELKDKLNKVGEELRIRIIVQHEDVFRYMHRV